MLSQCPDSLEINFIVFHCQDGYRVGMSLEDLKGSDVLLVDLHLKLTQDLHLILTHPGRQIMA